MGMARWAKARCAMSLAKNTASASLHFCDALGLRENGSVALLTSYGDERGKESRSSNVTVAGYLGSKSNWDILGKFWQNILTDEHVKVLHRTDMEPPFHGEFEGWSREHQIAVLRRAHLVIKRRTICGIGHSIKIK